MTIKKVNTLTDETIDYGKGYSEEDVKDIVKGWKFNGLFYERKNSDWIFIVE